MDIGAGQIKVTSGSGSLDSNYAIKIVSPLIPLLFSAPMSLPKLVAFDLDGTNWSPDMYMIWGGGAPFTVSSPTELDDSKI